MSRPIRIAVLASGRGSNLQAMIDAIEQLRLNATIALVASNNPNAYALNRAKLHRIMHLCLRQEAFTSRRDYELALVKHLKKQGVELVVLAGWMRILTKAFLKQFEDRVINIHPSLLPAFPGLNAQRQAFEYGVKYTGCTVHFVDSSLDGGPIIAQQVVPVQADDTLETLTNKILIEEHLLYPRVVELFSKNRIVKEGRKVTIKLN
jgi:phosphoribosylglycinamide formyltransferase-1